MYATLAHEILHEHGIAYAVTNAQLDIVHHSDNLVHDSYPTLRGVSLFTVVPEAAGHPEIFQALLAGTLDRWELPCIQRTTLTGESKFFRLRFSRSRIESFVHGILYIQHDLATVNVPPDELVGHHTELHAQREQALRELRAPLTPLRGYLEMLEDDEFGALTQEQRQVVTILRQSVLRLVQLSNSWDDPKRAL